MNRNVERIVLGSTMILLLSLGCSRAKPERTVVPLASAVPTAAVALSLTSAETAGATATRSLRETARVDTLASPSPRVTPTLVPSVEPTDILIASEPEPTNTPTEPLASPTPTLSGVREITYTVRAGDSVLAIAATHGTTVAAIVNRNGLADRHTIRVGRVLVIPLELAPSKTPESGTITPVGTAPAGRTHKVKPGECLSVIAAEYGVSVRSLAEANNVADPSLVRAGKVLVIPEE